MGQQTAQHGYKQKQISRHEYLNLFDFRDGLPERGSTCVVNNDSLHSAVHAPPGQPESLHHANIYFHQQQNGLDSPW
jgi:hypothetical protein